jgi:Ca-activated chloride channel homolog
MRNILVTFALAAAAIGSPAGQTFRSRIDLVNVGVTILDKKGSYITDLAQADFEIYEDGKKQEIKYFARGDDEKASAVELHLGALFDTSGSMGEDLKLARTAAIKFLNTLPNAADITLVDFDTEVRVARYGQDDFPRLVERIRNRDADGWTALYDALGVYLDGAQNQDGRKILVVYTDGGDTRSHITFSDVLTLLKVSDVTVYAIGLLEHQSSSSKMDQRMKLQSITETTGGQAFFPTSEKELDKMYDKVVEEMKAQYSLGYVSTNTKMDGSWRKVDIKFTRPDLKGTKLRTRKGYFAPYKESQKSSGR